MNRATLLLTALAERAWVVVRAPARAVLGEERLVRYLAASGLREWKARHWRFERTLPDGNRVIYRPHDQCFIEEIYTDRVYDSSQEFKPGQTVVDIGGHIGLFSLYTAKKVGPTGRVIVCEPGPNNFPILRQNLDMNGIPWISAHCCAIADKEGEADFFIAESGSKADNPATNSIFSGAGRRSVRVPVRTLDWLVDKEKITSIDHLKVDVEGAELLVLAGAERCLAMTRRITMEVHPGRVDPAEVNARLEKKGFRVKTLVKDPLVIEASR